MTQGRSWSPCRQKFQESAQGGRWHQSWSLRKGGRPLQRKLTASARSPQRRSVRWAVQTVPLKGFPRTRVLAQHTHRGS